MVSAAKQHLMIGSIDKDYSLVFQVERPCPLGLARFHFNKALAQVREEM